jgi:hypothetical protein
MSKADKAWLAFQNLETGYWTATAAAGGWGAAQYAFTGGTSGLVRARSMASYGVRAHWAAFRGVAQTPFYRGGSYTLGKASAAAMAGYMIGATIGTGIAYAMYGEQGSDTALDLYLPQFLGGKSSDELDYFGTISRKLATYS